MKIKYLAHAAFLITAENGTRIVTDPYKRSESLKFGAINETAEIVTASHEHGDHNNIAAVKGNPQSVNAAGEVKGIKIKAVPTAHDDKDGSQRGQNTVFCFLVDGVNICHLGDLGHELTAAQVEAIGKVDALLIPVGGFFTIDAATATKVCEQLKPKVIIPMHYKTEKLDFPISGVEDFLKGKNNVTRSQESELELKADSLPASPQIIVLKPAL
ncbi:MAG: MBL fold metallo-hydrolase [Dehalococcoidales bacterium]|jgi:L-ascorbate metabolism protein UlaG (beta-lactamase superfamily)